MTVDLGPIMREVNSVGRAIVEELGSQIDGVQVQVGTVRSDLQLTRSELTKLRQEFEEFVDQAAKVANIQESQGKVVELKAQLDREFGHYGKVRRSSVGLLQAFDIGNVSDATATQVAEELMIQTPRYWLAPALVALAAWSHDRPELAEKSVREAFTRDRHKTSLFFSLVLRRQGRLNASVRWLRHYVASLDSTALTREFAVILEAASYQAFGPEGEELLSQTMTDWCGELRNNQQIVDEQIGRWISEITSHQMVLNPGEYRLLQTISPEWTRLKAQLEAACALPPVLDKYTAVRDFEAPLPKSLEDMLDDILDGLVSEYDAEELPLRREVVFHQAVVEERGDLTRAQQKADLLQEALEETNDVVSLQTMAAISPQLLGVSTQTQKVAIGVSQSDFRAAIGRYCAYYRGQALDEVKLVFGPNHTNFAAQYGFGTVQTGSEEGQQKIEQRLSAEWESAINRRKEALKFSNSYYTKPGLIAGGIALVCLFLHIFLGLVAFVAGGAVVWYLGEQAKKAAQQQIDALERARVDALKVTLSLARDVLAEFADAMMIYRELDAFESPLLDMVNGWPTAAKEN